MLTVFQGHGGYCVVCMFMRVSSIWGTGFVGSQTGSKNTDDGGIGQELDVDNGTKEGRASSPEDDTSIVSHLE